MNLSGKLTVAEIATLTRLLTEHIKELANGEAPDWDELEELFGIRRRVRNLKPKSSSRRESSSRSSVARDSTSELAAEAESIGPQKGLVLSALLANAAHVLTADQVSEITGIERRSVSTYLSELARSGKVVRAGYGKYTAASARTEGADDVT
jgi:Fic family protein